MKKNYFFFILIILIIFIIFQLNGKTHISNLINKDNDFILVFITYSGLCNQFYDINTAINFCLNNNIKFTFKYASFRNNDLTSWYNVNFNKLFDTRFLEKYDLYIKPENINYNENNTINYNTKLLTNQLINLNQPILDQLKNFNKKYIILKQFWVLNDKIENNIDITPYILPSKIILNEYHRIKNNLLINNEKYNFIHYRYELDFIKHFNIKKNLSLKEVINKFNENLRIYIATTNINNILDQTDRNNIICKNDDELKNFDFEQKAFIDYMFGLNATNIIGHSKSSFSHTLIKLKKSGTFYDN